MNKTKMTELFNLKWFLLKMISKWYLFLVGTLIGTLLVGGGYFLVKVALAPARDYKAETVYYMEYASDPDAADVYTYFNEFTMNQWVLSDCFQEAVRQETGKAITEEELAKYVTSYILADTRVQTLTVTTSDPELTMAITRAYAKTFPVWAESQRELVSIRVTNLPESAPLVKADVRVARAVLLGAVLGLFFTCMILYLYFLYDDRIELPEQLADRHGLKVLGCTESAELSENIKAACGEGTAAVTCVGEAPNLAELTEALSENNRQTFFLAVPSVLMAPEAAKTLREIGKVILLVQAGEDTSKAVDRVLAFYEQQEIKVCGAILCGADWSLLKLYYGLPL